MPDVTVTGPVTPRWPGEARAACAFTFDLDAETLWMARGVSEPVALSQGRFGPVEAVPRILSLLEQAEARPSFSIPASPAAHYPAAARPIEAAGNEVGRSSGAHPPVWELAPKPAP